VDTLLSWIRISDLDLATCEAALELVTSALDEVEEDHPAYPWLVAAEAELEEGHFPHARLRRLVERFSLPTTVLDECAQLESELRSEAAGLPAALWRTPRLDRLIRWVEGEEVELEGIRQAVTLAWSNYQSVTLAADEVTAETVAGHRILLDGLEGWLDALDALESAADDEETQQALELAIQANRLLVAVQHLNQRVQAQVS